MRLAVIATLALAWAGACLGADLEGLQATAARNGGLIAVEKSDFKKVVLAANRPYHVFALFNAAKVGYNCDLCGPFQNEMGLLASSYLDLKAEDKEGEVPDVLFVTAEYEANTKTFSQYSIKSVPMMVYFEPTGKAPHSIKELPESVFAGQHTAEEMADFVKDQTGVAVEIYRSPVAALVTALMVLGMIASSVYYFGERILTFALWVRQFKLLWLLVCLSVFFISVSGVLYDIIRGVPWAGIDPQKRTVQWFSPQNGQQYIMEGLVIGTLNMACALAIIALVKLAPRCGKENVMVVGSVSAALFAIVYFSIFSLYRAKNYWYFRT